MQNSDPTCKDRAVGLPGWQLSLLFAATGQGPSCLYRMTRRCKRAKLGDRHPSKGASQLKIRIYLGTRVSFL